MNTQHQKKYQIVNGTSYDERTPVEVARLLENQRVSGTRVRLFFGDTTTGKAWPEENDVTGRLGRSMGPVKVPILLAKGNSMGGGAVLDHCIVAILTEHGWLYKHPTFSTGEWVIQPILSDEDNPFHPESPEGRAWYEEHNHHNKLYNDGYRSEVTLDGNVHARFKGNGHEARAERYVAFMTGRRMGR